MEGRFLLDVIVRESPSVLQLLSSKDEPLLVWGDSFLVLDLSFDILNAIRGLDLKGDGLPSQSLDKDLHTTSKSENKMESAFLLYVVVRESPSVLQLLSSKDEPLLVWWDSFLILDLSFDILNGVRSLNLKGDSLSSQSLDKDLHTTPKPENKMESAFLLYVVVRESSSIFKLFSCKDQPLLVWGDSFLVLDLSFDIVDCVRGLNLEGDGLPSQSLNEDLHSTSKTEHKMESAFLLDVVVRESSSVLQLLSSKNEPLLVWRDSFFVLNLGLDILNAIGGLNL